METLTGHFDASGAPDQGTILVVGGFISSESRWYVFETRWSAALRQAGLACFHMEEFINRKGEFVGWKQRPRERLLNKLGQIVVDTVVRSYASIVVLDDWNEVDQEYELAENDFQPYALAGWSCVGRTLGWCKGHLYNSVFVFEHGDKHQRNLLNKVEDDLGIPIRTALKKPDRRKPNEAPVTQLQSADFAAWQVLNVMRPVQAGLRLTRELERVIEPWLWESFHRLFISVPYDHSHFSLERGPRTGRSSLIRLCEDKGIPRRIAH